MSVVLEKPKTKKKKTLKKSLTKRIAEYNKAGEKLEKKDLAARGLLQPIASHMVARMMYAARNCRIDMLRAVARLSCFIHYWDIECDAKINRLMAYVC